MVFRSAGNDLVWTDWDDVYIVYQPASAETHVFNEITALILRTLQNGPRSAEAIRNGIAAALGIEDGELAEDDFAFAANRLEELGLIERLDRACAGQ